MWSYSYLLVAIATATATATADKYWLIIGILYMNKYVFCFLSSFNCYKNIGIVDSLNINIVYQAGRAVR